MPRNVVDIGGYVARMQHVCSIIYSKFVVGIKNDKREADTLMACLHELLYHNCMIGDFINNGILIKSDYFVGDTKAVLSVGFRYGKTVDMPVTLYNEIVKKLIKPVCKVIAIFKKPYDQAVYSDCTYCSKGTKLDTLQLPDKVKIAEGVTQDKDNT